jgi:hypothetical protein
MTSKGRAAKEQQAVTDSVVGDTSYIDNIFSTPSGLLNSLELPVAVADRLSSTADIFSTIKGAVKKINSPDLTTGISHFKGIVMRIEDQSKSSFLGSIVSSLGLGEAGGFINAKVLVPELHKMLPRPFGKGHPEYPKQKNRNDLIIDLYPTFSSISNNPEFSEIKVGDIVTISYRSKNNYTTSADPIIVSKYATSAGNIASGVDCVDTNRYAAGPPPGDALAGGQRQTSHTGGTSPAKRSRNKRSVAQIFIHEESGDSLAKNLSTMAISRGYSLNVFDSPPNKGAKIVEEGKEKYYKHNITLAQMIGDDDLISPENSHFTRSAENITIVYRLPYSDTALLEGYQAELQRVKSTFSSLINIIDQRTKNAPTINFVLDPSWEHWQDIRVSACLSLATDISFLSSFTDGTTRINFFDTIPSDYGSTKLGGTFSARQPSTQLAPEESAKFVEHISKGFREGDVARMVSKKKPAPTPGPIRSPALPSGVNIDSIIRSALQNNNFSSTAEAEQFLTSISARTNVAFQDLITSDPRDPNSFVNAGIGPDLTSEIVGATIPANEILQYTEKLKQKIKMAIDFSSAASFANPEAQGPAQSVNSLGIPKRRLPGAAGATNGPCGDGTIVEAGQDGIPKKERVARSRSATGALPGYESYQQQYAFRKQFKRKSTSYIIIHNPGGGWRSVETLANGLNNKGLGVHFVVTPNGSVRQLVDMSVGVYQASPLNFDSISIEVANASTQGMTNRVYKPGSRQQLESLYRLVRTICKHTSIPFRFPPALVSQGKFSNSYKASRWNGVRPGVFGHGQFEASTKQHSDGKFETLYMSLRKKGISSSKAYAAAVRIERLYNETGGRKKGRLGLLDVPEYGAGPAPSAADVLRDANGGAELDPLLKKALTSGEGAGTVLAPDAAAPEADKSQIDAQYNALFGNSSSNGSTPATVLQP